MAIKPDLPIRIASAPFALLLGLIKRLYIEHHAAMDSLTKGTDFSSRMEGFSRAKRTDAEFLLLAIGPSILESIIDYFVVGHYPWLRAMNLFGTIWFVLGGIVLLGSYASWFVKNSALYRRRK